MLGCLHVATLRITVICQCNKGCHSTSSTTAGCGECAPCQKCASSCTALFLLRSVTVSTLCAMRPCWPRTDADLLAACATNAE